MKAIDTNIVLRVILRDDPAQSPIAAAYVEQGVFVSDGVLMETEWVLRSLASWTRRRINDALSAFVALKTVSVSRPEMLVWALDRHRAGADWADMLHVIAARGTEAFLTFDADVKKRVGAECPTLIELLR